MITTVTLFYGVGELWVAESRVGARIVSSTGTAVVAIDLPTADGAFHGGLQTKQVAVSGSVGDPRTHVGATLVRCAVQIPDDIQPRGKGNVEIDFVKRADVAATAALQGLLTWARSHEGQVTVLRRHERPEPVGIVHLETSDGYEWRMSGSVRPHVIVMQSPEAWDAIGALDVPEAVLAGEAAPHPAEELLVAARQAIWPAFDPDPQQAVLLSAIALEVKAPQVLLASAGAETRPFVEQLLAPSGESTSTNYRLNMMAAMVLGESLKEHDGTLNKAVKELFERRNLVAHQGKVPTVDDASESVQAAARAFEWLDQRAAALLK